MQGFTGLASLHHSQHKNFSDHARISCYWIKFYLNGHGYANINTVEVIEIRLLESLIILSEPASIQSGTLCSININIHFTNYIHYNLYRERENHDSIIRSKCKIWIDSSDGSRFRLISAGISVFKQSKYWECCFQSDRTLQFIYERMQTKEWICNCLISLLFIIRHQTILYFVGRLQSPPQR